MSLILRNRAVSLLCLLGLSAALPLSAQSPRDRWIALFPGDAEPVLQSSSVPVWDREESVVVAGPSESQLDVLRAQGIEPLFNARDHGESIQVLSHDGHFDPPALAGAPRFRIDDQTMLYLLPRGWR